MYSLNSARWSVQAVLVPNKHLVDKPGLNVTQQALVLGAGVHRCRRRLNYRRRDGDGVAPRGGGVSTCLFLTLSSLQSSEMRAYTSALSLVVVMAA